MAKSLEMSFALDDGRTMQISIPYPKEDLTLDTVKEKAAIIMPILEASSGASPVSLKQAKITETTSTVLE